MTDHPPSPSAKASAFCLACGLCCEGNFFFHDVNPATYGMHAEPNHLSHSSPCRLFRQDEKKCVIYLDPQRPTICKTFQCSLLKIVMQNEINLEDARTVIEKIRAALEKALAHLPRHETRQPVLWTTQRVFDSIQKELETGDRTNLELYWDIASLHFLVEQYIAPYQNLENKTGAASN